MWVYDDVSAGEWHSADSSPNASFASVNMAIIEECMLSLPSHPNLHRKYIYMKIFLLPYSISYFQSTIIRGYKEDIKRELRAGCHGVKDRNIEFSFILCSRP